MLRKSIAVVFCAVSVSCVAANDSPSSTGSRTQAIVTNNKLTANKLTANKLTANKLTANKLTANRLADGTLSFNSAAGDGIESTADGREVLQYLSTCSLAEQDILTVTYDGVTYQYPGLLGLAPEWTTRALTESEKQMVSACLFAHVNAYGVSVPISVRAYGVLSAEMAEMSAYRVYEGSFFGMGFVSEGEAIKWYSCQGDDAEVALELSSDRALRACTDSTGECEIESLGRCRDVCDTRTPDHGWSGCWAYGVRYAQTISTYLRSDMAGVAVCGTLQSCGLESEPLGAAAILDCSGALGCDATCDGGVCAIDGTMAVTLGASVATSAVADVSCHAAGTCVVECQPGSRCEIDGKDADSAFTECHGDASCLLDCTGTAACGFLYCATGAVSCEGDILVCNRACP